MQSVNGQVLLQCLPVACAYIRLVLPLAVLSPSLALSLPYLSLSSTIQFPLTHLLRTALAAGVVGRTLL